MHHATSSNVSADVRITFRHPVCRLLGQTMSLCRQELPSRWKHNPRETVTLFKAKPKRAVRSATTKLQTFHIIAVISQQRLPSSDTKLDKSADPRAPSRTSSLQLHPPALLHTKPSSWPERASGASPFPSLPWEYCSASS